MAFHGHQVDEALVAFGVFRTLSSRQQILVLHSDQHGVDHLVLGRAGMDAQAAEGCLCGACVEVFVLNAAHGTAVGGVGIVGTETGNIKLVSAPADFLVGGEADLQGGMLHIMGQQILGSCHDLSNACLVISAQQSGAVGNDQVLAPVVGQALVVLFPHPDILLFVQADIAALIVHNPGLDIGAGAAGCSVHVGNQADGRQAGIAGNGAVDIAVLVHVGVSNAHGQHFFHNGCTQNLLLGGGGAAGGFFVRLGVKRDIAQEALNNRTHILTPYN